MRRYLIFLKPVPDSQDHITSEIGYLFYGHQNWIQCFTQHAVVISILKTIQKCNKLLIIENMLWAP